MAPGRVNGKEGITQAEWDKVNEFLKVTVKPEYYSGIITDDDLTTIELRTLLDRDGNGRITASDAVVGNYNCSLFRDVATILASHGVAFIHRFNPADVRCEEVPFFREEKRLFALLEKSNDPDTAKEFIQKLKDPECRKRMAALADRYFHTEDFSASLDKVEQKETVSRELALVRATMSRIETTIRALEADQKLSDSERISQIEKLEKMLEDLRRAAVTL